MAKIILVEDEVIIAETIKIHLESRGHEIMEHFISGEETLEYLFNDNNPTPELIMFDINLAGQLSGIQTAEKISHSMDIPFIYLTGNGDIKNINDAKATLPYGYILKPYDDRILLLTVEMALNRALNDKSFKNLKSQLEAQNRLAELGETFGGLCHDLVSPLGVVNERTSLLINHVGKSDHLERDILLKKLAKISESTEHCLQMVKDCKHWINSQADEEPTHISIFELAKDASELCKVKLEQNHVKLVFEDDLKDIFVSCQKVKLLNVLSNLVNNAIDAIKDLDTKSVTITSKQNSDITYLYVTDSGPGIPSEIQDKIFEALFTTKDANTGTGLGLSVSKKMLEAQGGDLHLDTEHPNTRFVIQLQNGASTE